VPSEREGAVALLSSLTVFLEHHPALLAAGVLPALVRAVVDADTIPQVPCRGTAAPHRSLGHCTALRWARAPSLPSVPSDSMTAWGTPHGSVHGPPAERWGPQTCVCSIMFVAVRSCPTRLSLPSPDAAAATGQVRTLALGCTADLMKADEAQRAVAESPDFLPTVLDALQVGAGRS